MNWPVSDRTAAEGWGTMDPAIWGEQIDLYAQLNQFSKRVPKVEEVMTAEVDYCYEDDSVGDAVQKMQKRQIRRLPIVDRDKKLVGIVALGDLATDLDKPKKVAETLGKISEPSRPDRGPRSEAAD